MTLLRRAAERHTNSPCRETMARDAAGEPVPPTSPHARAWCAIGAVRATKVSVAQRGHAEEILRGVAWQFGIRGLITANDEHPDIMPDIWSEAIEYDEAKPLTGKALLAARAYEARRRAMSSRVGPKPSTSNTVNSDTGALTMRARPKGTKQ
jgi:hypothetical protein